MTHHIRLLCRSSDDRKSREGNYDPWKHKSSKLAKSAGEGTKQVGDLLLKQAKWRRTKRRVHTSQPGPHPDEPSSFPIDKGLWGDTHETWHSWRRNVLCREGGAQCGRLSKIKIGLPESVLHAHVSVLLSTCARRRGHLQSHLSNAYPALSMHEWVDSDV